MPPRSWLFLSLLLVIWLTDCQPVRPIARRTPTVAAAPVLAAPSTSSTGASDCPILRDQPLDLIIAPNWQAGDVRRYQASYSSTPIRDGKARSTITTSYPMSITVLDANEDGYLMEWRSIAVLDSPRKIRLEYIASPYGEFVQFGNLGEIRNLVNPVIVANGEVDLVAITGSDLQAFHAIYGLYFTNTDPYQLEEETTFLSPEIPGTNKINVSLTRYDKAKGCLDLLWQSQWMMGAAADTDAIWDTRALFHFDLKSGWPQSVEIEHTYSYDGIGERTKLILTAVTPTE